MKSFINIWVTYAVQFINIIDLLLYRGVWLLLKIRKKRSILKSLQQIWKSNCYCLVRKQNIVWLLHPQWYSVQSQFFFWQQDKKWWDKHAKKSLSRVPSTHLDQWRVLHWPEQIVRTEEVELLNIEIWHNSDWNQLLFTDECQISLKYDARRVLVCRERGTWNYPTGKITV